MKTKTYSYKVASPLTTAKTKIKSAVRKETLPQFIPEVDPEDEFDENFKRYQFLMSERNAIDSELKELKDYFRPQLKAQEQDGEGKDYITTMKLLGLLLVQNLYMNTLKRFDYKKLN